MSATLRRDRDGELVQAHVETDERHDCGTQDLRGAARGFLGEDSEGRPRYCPICRPWTTPRARAQRVRSGVPIETFG